MWVWTVDTFMGLDVYSEDFNEACKVHVSTFDSSNIFFLDTGNESVKLHFYLIIQIVAIPFWWKSLVNVVSGYLS